MMYILSFYWVKFAIVSKLLGSSAPSIAELSKKNGVTKSTMYSWLKIVRSREPLDIPKRVKHLSTWTQKEKLKALLDTANMSEEQLNAYELKYRDFDNQANEVFLKCGILNQFLIIGLANSVAYR